MELNKNEEVKMITDDPAQVESPEVGTQVEAIIDQNEPRSLTEPEILINNTDLVSMTEPLKKEENLEPGKTALEIQPQSPITNNINALSLLAQYSSSDDEDDDDDEDPQASIYRKPVEDSSSSSSSSDSDDELDMKVIEKKIREPVVSDGDSDEEGDNKKKKREPLKVKGEMTIDDLPPIQDLQITVDEKECVEIGVITTVVDKLVLVEALRNSVPLDIDSVLFLDNGKKTLGKVFDVIGPVNMPIYCIRFNTHEEISEKGIAVGNKVFCAPRTEHSSFVVLSQVMTKGSDASWKFDIEPPENLVEYSDDEQERRTKRQSKSNRQNNSGERREFVRGRRFMPQQQGQMQNLAYPNYSWHQNLNQPPPPPPGYFQNFY